MSDFVVPVISRNNPQVKIPGYLIESELGRGGVASVYLALQESLDRRVALKIMSPALAAEPNFSDRFLREGRTVAQLNHPHIVTIYDIGVVDYQHYIAMEYVSEGSLKQRIDKPLELDWIFSIIRQIALALGYAHGKGFVHRDVKPENILFRANHTAVLSDFGIAKSATSSTQLTSAGSIVGTPRYMSPEQASGKSADARADIYALGVILYEMLAGKPPYETPESLAVLYAHINNPIPVLPVEYKSLQPLVDSMMAKDPDDRVPDCETLIDIITLVRRDRRYPGKSKRSKESKTSNKRAADLLTTQKIKRQTGKEVIKGSNGELVEKSRRAGGWAKRSISFFGLVGLVLVTIYVISLDPPSVGPVQDEKSKVLETSKSAKQKKKTAKSPAVPPPKPQPAEIVESNKSKDSSLQKVNSIGKVPVKDKVREEIVVVKALDEEIPIPHPEPILEKNLPSITPVNLNLDKSVADNAESVAIAEPKPVIEEKPKAELVVDSKQGSKTESEPTAVRSELNVEPEVVEFKEVPSSRPEPRSEPKLDPKPELKAESIPELTLEPAPELKLELTAKPAPEPKPKPKTEPKPKPVSKPGPKVKTVVVAKVDKRPTVKVISGQDRLEIDRLLAQAKIQISADRLSHPPGNNALASFRRVLELDQDNEQAKEGLIQLAERYHRLASVNMREKKTNSALLYIERGLEVVKNDPALLQLQKRLQDSLTAKAEFKQAEKYFDGVGVARDYEQAADLYRRAALKGHIGAQKGLAFCFVNGLGLKRDEKKSKDWFRKAALEGDSEAQYNLGLGLLFGKNRNPGEAAKWISKAVKQEYRRAYRVYGWMYESGTGVERSAKYSFKWGFKGVVDEMRDGTGKGVRTAKSWEEAFQDVRIVPNG